MPSCPSRNEITGHADAAFNRVNVFSKDWYAVEEFLSWYRLDIALRSMATDDPATRAKMLGRGALAQDLLERAEQRRKGPTTEKTQDLGDTEQT